MGTLAEEIFSYKLGRPVKAGETVVVEVDHVMSHDTTTPLAIQAFRKLTKQTGGRVFTRGRCFLKARGRDLKTCGRHSLSVYGTRRTEIWIRNRKSPPRNSQRAIRNA